MPDDSVQRANELLSVHPLAAVRLAAWDTRRSEATFEVFHCEWPDQVFGELRFLEVSYLQVPTATSWGYRLRIARNATRPSFSEPDPGDIVYELFAPDGQEPSAFVVARALACQTRALDEPAASP
ncbi:MAG TPA: hypothetical protein VLM85_34010 [Polyangiaceae bacterium]|nr:hypothetical protein [Polyangiaceae bacterium]